MSARAETTFLGLPTELRLKIYNYIIHADPECIILRDIQHVTGSNGTQAVLLGNSKANLRSHLSWLDLQLTCSAIASEIRSYMTGPSFLNVEENCTYVLDLDVYNNSGSSKANRLATWRSLPCHPADAKVLIVNVATRRGPAPWTEGGPASLARALYQIFNHLVHKGPKIVTTPLLPDHMRLRELIVNVDIGVDCEYPALGCNTVTERNYRLLVTGWGQVSKTGFLMDYLERTKIRRIDDDGSEIDIPVEWQKFPSIPGYWSGYGFQWGV